MSNQKSIIMEILVNDSELRNLSDSDFRLLREHIKYEADRRVMAASSKFRFGDEVSFKTRKGNRVIGKITKINRKTCHVLTEGRTTWTVTSSLLSLHKSK